MKTILFAHSAGPQYGKGKGSYDLVKFLKTELPDHKILFPKIEKPAAPTYAKYKKMYTVAFAKISDPIILVGHSLGASTLLKYLSEEKPSIPITGLFLVSTPFWGNNMKEFQLEEDFQLSLPAIPITFLYHSKQDEDVPFEHLHIYSAALKGAIVRELDGKEHVFATGLPALVSDIKSL